VERAFLNGRYHLAGGLVLAAIVSGIGKIANSFSKAIVAAVADPPELSRVNVVGWASVGVSLAAAYVGAHWGLAGVIYGVALGWYLRAAISWALVLRHLRLPAALPATAP
jgi:Na+-driven multidrug efflux pump